MANAQSGQMFALCMLSHTPSPPILEGWGCRTEKNLMGKAKILLVFIFRKCKIVGETHYACLASQE